MDGEATVGGWWSNCGWVDGEATVDECNCGGWRSNHGWMVEQPWVSATVGGWMAMQPWMDGRATVGEATVGAGDTQEWVGQQNDVTEVCHAVLTD
jgi:hypothetical protein